MTARGLVGLAAAGSGLLLLAAFAFQHLGGLAPCNLCLWQRWPHGVALVLGAAVYVGALPWLAWGGAMAMVSNAALGAYHSGIERGWWPGPAACRGGEGLAGLSGEDLVDVASAAPVVLCDEVAWSALGLSMASWNALASLALAAVWIAAARREC